MHDSSIREMTKFAASLPAGPLRIADVGSRGDWNYASLFSKPGWVYVGMDMQPGTNVHRILESPYDWREVAGGAFDVVVSGQCIEHVPMPWRWMREVARITKQGGLVCVIGPHSWEYHPSPLDCWRVWPDGLRACMEDAGLLVVSCHMNENDSVGVARKP